MLDMSLFTKCILRERNPEDGTRISVMSRHTLPDGKTPDRRIKKENLDGHLSQLGPSPKLIGDYYKRGLSWEEFKERYLEEIRCESKLSIVKTLALMANLSDITILCIEESHEKCHRKLLAEECRKYVPSLTIEHR